MSAGQIDWGTACEGVPSEDFLDGLELPHGTDEAISNFSFAIEKGMFVAWEGVIRLEQGLSLSKAERKAAQSLYSGGDPGRVLYIDGLSRPQRPWHATLNTITEVLVGKVDTVEFDVAFTEGWDELQNAVNEWGADLRLPPGVIAPLEVVPDPIRWRLDVQASLGILCGIGQRPELSLREDEQRRWRLPLLLKDLSECTDSIHSLDLTLDGLLDILCMPSRDKRVLRRVLQKKLDIQSPEDRLSERLKARRQRRKHKTGLPDGDPANKGPEEV